MPPRWITLWLRMRHGEMERDRLGLQWALDDVMAALVDGVRVVLRALVPNRPREIGYH